MSLLSKSNAWDDIGFRIRNLLEDCNLKFHDEVYKSLENMNQSGLSVASRCLSKKLD